MSTGTRIAAQGRVQGTEWPTVALIVLCYGGWGATLFWLAPAAPALSVFLAGALIALHASLIHEVLHGHPFRSQFLNELVVRLPLNLVIPYCRFRDQHLDHHRDSNLTDPYDDPETNFLDPEVWNRLPGWRRALLRFNNTLGGRILVGPALGIWVFLRGELRLVAGGDRRVIMAWVLHAAGVAAVIWIVLRSPMPLPAYLVAAYIALGLLKVRTFLEHRAHDKARCRTVVVEDRGPLALLFLNNNFHVVHHMNPAVAWYRLPALYRAGRERYLSYNDGYVYRSYAEVFRRHFLHGKDPVAHPLWRRK